MDGMSSRIRASCAALGISAALGLSLSAAVAAAAPRLASGSAKDAAGTLTAGADGAEYVIAGGTRIRASSGASYKIFGRPQQLLLRPGAKTDTYTIMLYAGRLTVQVPSTGKQRPAVLVAAPNKVSTIAIGGQLTIVADAAGVSVANRDGEALTGLNTRYKPQDAGTVRTFTRESPNGEPQPLLGHAEFLPGRRLWLTTTGSATVGGFAWRPVPGATSYDVLLRRSGEPDAIKTLRVGDTKLDRIAEAVPPGVYTLSVRAVDNRGIEAGKLASTHLQVVGVQVPDGAFIDRDGAIRLAGDQKVTFTHADGLEYTHTGNGHLTPAGTPVGLNREANTLVMLHNRDTKDAVSVRLKPRGGSAEVWVGPKYAVWPKDAITIKVRLKSGPAGSSPELKINPKVMLGIDPLDVEWQRDGDVLTAKVLPQATPGPWVVRVDVLDQYGVSLGYDFCEVIPADGVRSPRLPRSQQPREQVARADH
jgi:hypothetical protein